MKDNFSQQAAIYAQYRPSYPQELFDYLVSWVPEKNIAWDCGTGNGQSAIVLSKVFNKVIATDISNQQLEHAQKAPNIFYSQQPAEQTTIETGTIDLVTVSQAMHWFDFDKFYEQVNRVAKPGAIIAIWTYSLIHIGESIDLLIRDYHFNLLGKYWDAERKYVDDEYRNIPFPYQKISAPAFKIEAEWSLQELEGYLNTSSALQKFMTAHGFSPVPELIQSIRLHWGNWEKRKIIFPIHLLLGTIKSITP